MDITIQTHIRNTDSHPGTDSEKIDLDLATNGFLKLLLKYRKELPTTKLLTKKQVSRN